MRIRWENVFGLTLFVLLIYLFIKMRPFLQNIFDDINSAHYNRGDIVFRELALSILCITVIATVAILSGRKK